MAYKYTGGKTVTVTVGNLAADTIACAYWYTGAVSPTGASYTIKGLLDDGNNSTSTDFSYNTVLKATASSPSSTSVTFKTVDNIYDSTNGRYPKYVLAYVKLLPHFHNSNKYGTAIQTENIEIRQRQNSISSNTSSMTIYWNKNGATSTTGTTQAITCAPTNSYTSTINVSTSNSSVIGIPSSTMTSGNTLTLTAKKAGTATITCSPSDGAGGTSKTISVTSKTAVTSMSATYTGDLNTGATTSITVSKTPSDAAATTFTISRSSGTAAFPSSGTFGSAFSVSSTSGSPVLKFTSADNLVTKSIKITNYTATLACSGSTPIKNEIFTYTKSGGYGEGTYTFSGCQHSSPGKAKVIANSGTATVSWTPIDGGSAQSASIQLGNSTTDISPSSYTDNLNNGADTTVTVSRTPSNTKVGTFTASLVSGSAIISTASTNYGSFSIKDVANSPVIKFTSGDGLVSKSIKITTSAAILSNTASTPIKNEIFTYTKSGGYGSGTYTFSGCQHSSAGKAKVIAESGSASVTWTPNDGGWAQSTKIQLGVSTTKITINNDASTSGTLSINKGATAKMKVNLYGPNDATPKNTNFTASISGTGTLSSTTGTNGATINVTGATNGARFNVTSGDGFVSSGQNIAVYTPSASVARNESASLGNEFTYTVSNYTGTGTWTVSGTTTSYVSAGKRKMSGNGTTTVTWTPADGGTPVSANYTYNTGSTTLSKSLVSNNATYYGNGIYWDKYSVSITNANGRKITVSVSNGYVGTTTSSKSTSISVASGTNIYIRNTGSTNASVTLSASAYRSVSTTSYTFYSKPSNVTFSIS